VLLRKYGMHDIDEEKEIEKLQAEVENLENQLMEVEMKLVESLSEATGNFKNKLDAITEDMKKETINYIKDVADINESYHGEVKVYCEKLHEDFSKDIENGLNAWSEEQEDLTLLLSEKDTLMHLVESSHDTQQSKISDKENEITRGIVDDTNDYLKNLREKQHKRNRDIVKEVIELVKQLKEEIDSDRGNKSRDNHY